MNVISIKTHKITGKDTDILKILDTYIINVSEGSVVAITSKIISICEGSLESIKDSDKDKLIHQESQFYLPRSGNKYRVSFAIAKGVLAAGGGIDESNGGGQYVLWPKDPQKSANKIREYLSKKFNIKHLGIIITDSRTTPLRWGVTAFSLAYSGFNPLKNYIGTKDLFGRKFEYEKLNISDSLATSAAVVMGEGNEQTPIAIINDISFVQFQDRNPTKSELNDLKISKEDDLYGPFLQSVTWKKGSAKQNSSSET